MKDFQIIEVEQLKDTSRYSLVEDEIYLDLKDKEGFAAYRIAMAMTLEEGEDSELK